MTFQCPNPVPLCKRTKKPGRASSYQAFVTWHSVNFALDHKLEVTPQGNIEDLCAFYARRKVDVAGYRACHSDGISRSLVQHNEKMTNTEHETHTESQLHQLNPMKLKDASEVL